MNKITREEFELHRCAKDAWFLWSRIEAVQSSETMSVDDVESILENVYVKTIGPMFPGSEWRILLDAIIKAVQPLTIKQGFGPMSAEIDRTGNALNEAGWACIRAWSEMGIPPMDGDTWNNLKQGLVYPTVKAYLDNLPKPTPDKVPKTTAEKRAITTMTDPNEIDELCKAAGIPLEATE